MTQRDDTNRDETILDGLEDAVGAPEATRRDYDRLEDDDLNDMPPGPRRDRRMEPPEDPPRTVHVCDGDPPPGWDDFDDVDPPPLPDDSDEVRIRPCSGTKPRSGSRESYRNHRPQGDRPVVPARSFSEPGRKCHSLAP
jgi:hypothetical protein